MHPFPYHICNSLIMCIVCQVAEYWNNWPQVTISPANELPAFSASLQLGGGHDSLLSEYDWHCQTLISEEADVEWSSELCHYLKEVPADVTRDTDIVKWWSDHAKVYPTLTHVALDILPMQTSSVPCEQIFSAAKHIATDCRAQLSPAVFKE